MEAFLSPKAKMKIYRPDKFFNSHHVDCLVATGLEMRTRDGRVAMEIGIARSLLSALLFYLHVKNEILGMLKQMII